MMSCHKLQWMWANHYTRISCSTRATTTRTKPIDGSEPGTTESNTFIALPKKIKKFTVRKISNPEAITSPTSSPNPSKEPLRQPKFSPTNTKFNVTPHVSPIVSYLENKSQGQSQSRKSSVNSNGDSQNINTNKNCVSCEKLKRNTINMNFELKN